MLDISTNADTKCTVSYRIFAILLCMFIAIGIDSIIERFDIV